MYICTYSTVVDCICTCIYICRTSRGSPTRLATSARCGDSSSSRARSLVHTAPRTWTPGHPSTDPLHTASTAPTHCKHQATRALGSQHAWRERPPTSPPAAVCAQLPGPCCPYPSRTSVGSCGASNRCRVRTLLPERRKIVLSGQARKVQDAHDACMLNLGENACSIARCGNSVCAACPSPLLITPDTQPIPRRLKLHPRLQSPTPKPSNCFFASST